MLEDSQWQPHHLQLSNLPDGLPGHALLDYLLDRLLLQLLPPLKHSLGALWLISKFGQVREQPH
jgi:hypothetical protein